MIELWMLIIRRAHFEINVALWSGLTAALCIFGLFIAPNIRNYQAAYEAEKATEISFENDQYCRRWHFAPGTDAYRSCLDDLHALRKSIENRLEAENAF